MRFLSAFLLISILLLTQTHLFSRSLSNDKQVIDSIIKYGVDVEKLILKQTKTKKLVEGFNYSPHINKILRENKYVKFPPYSISIGIDSSAGNNFKNHLVINSGNRLYFPKGSKLVTSSHIKTNGYMVYLDQRVSDVVIKGLTIEGAKLNNDYITSPYGACIALYAPSNVRIYNANVSYSTGDGVTIRTNWGKQSENILFDDLNISNSTRVGMLITGVIDGSFSNITIEKTGELDKNKILKPQTGLSFEPNDCSSKYVNCRFYNLKTINNLGPVVATANFSNIMINQSCEPEEIDIVIDNWEDIINDSNCYGASLDISTFKSVERKDVYDRSKLRGTVTISNIVFNRNTGNPNLDRYYILGKDEDLQGGVKYTLENVRVLSQGKKYSFSNEKFRSTFRNSKKVTFKR